MNPVGKSPETLIPSQIRYIDQYTGYEFLDTQPVHISRSLTYFSQPSFHVHLFFSISGQNENFRNKPANADSHPNRIHIAVQRIWIFRYSTNTYFLMLKMFFSAFISMYKKIISISRQNQIIGNKSANAHSHPNKIHHGKNCFIYKYFGVIMCNLNY